MYHNLIKCSQIIEKRKDSDMRIVVAIDNRTFKEQDTHHIYPIAEYNECSYIICPLCGEIHTHGKVSGYRVPHCCNLNLRKEGYYIEDIVTDMAT